MEEPEVRGHQRGKRLVVADLLVPRDRVFLQGDRGPERIGASVLNRRKLNDREGALLLLPYRVGGPGPRDLVSEGRSDSPVRRAVEGDLKGRLCQRNRGSSELGHPTDESLELLLARVGDVRLHEHVFAVVPVEDPDGPVKSRQRYLLDVVVVDEGVDLPEAGEVLEDVVEELAVGVLHYLEEARLLRRLPEVLLHDRLDGAGGLRRDGVDQVLP